MSSEAGSRRRQYSANISSRQNRATAATPGPPVIRFFVGVNVHVHRDADAGMTEPAGYDLDGNPGPPRGELVTPTGCADCGLFVVRRWGVAVLHAVHRFTVASTVVTRCTDASVETIRRNVRGTRRGLEGKVAFQEVVTRSSDDQVITRTAEEEVVPRLTIDIVPAEATDDGVDAGAPPAKVIARR